MSITQDFGVRPVWWISSVATLASPYHGSSCGYKAVASLTAVTEGTILQSKSKSGLAKCTHLGDSFASLGNVEYDAGCAGYLIAAFADCSSVAV